MAIRIIEWVLPYLAALACAAEAPKDPTPANRHSRSNTDRACTHKYEIIF